MSTGNNISEGPAVSAKKPAGIPLPLSVATPGGGINLPNWQAERAMILQRACLSIQAAVKSGKPIGRTIRRVSRYYHGNPYKCDAGRRLALRPGTLRAIWDVWKREGQRAAFDLHYKMRRPAVTAPTLIRFVNFCASGRYRSLTAAWKQFAAGGGQAARVSFPEVTFYFPAAWFYLIRQELLAVTAAQGRLNDLRTTMAAHIRQRLPRRAGANPSKKGHTNG